MPKRKREDGASTTTIEGQIEINEGEKTFSPLELLPVELFRKVLLQLPDSAVLALKFTCRATYCKTKHEDGSEIVHILPPSRSYFEVAGRRLRDSAYFATVMVAVEANLPHTIQLARLTCATCARSKDNSVAGFSDAQFKRSKLSRQCLACTTQDIMSSGVTGYRDFSVKGSSMFICSQCHGVRLNCNKMKPEQIEGLTRRLEELDRANAARAILELSPRPSSNLPLCEQCYSDHDRAASEDDDYYEYLKYREERLNRRRKFATLLS